ncbi:MAG: YkgJ family cysteine cluster protein [candidate division Zixibacteria bacterium]|nr:YkgJ family cysteine cluster protein [candidate division Zixibacteria bacterium]
MREIENLKEAILKEYPRLDIDSEFEFKCHPGVACFNDCCGDVNIFLTPYDIIRLKNRLGITSEDFLKKHTLTPFDKNLPYPIVLLQMQENEKKSCPFVGETGCQVYEDRPWACRMYPLGLASPAEDNKQVDKEFYFLLKESVCKGFDSDRKITVSGWLKDQGIEDYNEMGEYFKDITLSKFFQDEKNLTPKKLEMFFTVCYNIDMFHKFLFESSFFDKFEIDDATKAKIKDDDVELLKFGYQWLRFALFGENTITVKGDVLQAKKTELDQQKKQS